MNICLFLEIAEVNIFTIGKSQHKLTASLTTDLHNISGRACWIPQLLHHMFPVRIVGKFHCYVCMLKHTCFIIYAIFLHPFSCWWTNDQCQLFYCRELFIQNCGKMSCALFEIVKKWDTHCTKIWKNESRTVQNCGNISCPLFILISKLWKNESHTFHKLNFEKNESRAVQNL